MYLDVDTQNTHIHTELVGKIDCVKKIPSDGYELN